MECSVSKIRWRYGLLAATLVTLVAIAPQIYFCGVRGSQWNGAFAQTHGDESVYAAYLNALIEGRPRRNNPYTGRDDLQREESYLSVQLIPPVVLGGIARLAHLSTAQTFIGLTALTAFASALAIFWLLAGITGDSRVAAAGVMLVLFLSSANLIVEHLLRLGDSNNYLPFLRRYLPAVPFPILFSYCALVWRMLTAKSNRVRVFCALGAGLLFAFLVFSYIYHWTFALVWTFCLAAVWLFFRTDRKRTCSLLALIGLLMVTALAPYFVLTSMLGNTTAEVHFLASSRAPDLLRLPELAGLLTLIVLLVLAYRGRLKTSDPAVLFTIAFAVTPFLLFNQQIITGRSLQPFHYEVFIGNYTAVLALFLTALFVVRGLATRQQTLAGVLGIALGCAALLSGCTEAFLLSRRQMKGNLISDKARPALMRLAAIGPSTNGGRLDTKSVVYAPNFVVANSLPGTTSQPVLWGQYLFLFPDVTLVEDKERLAQFLYYKGVSFADIDEYHFDSLDNERGYYLSSLIRRGRFNPRLSVDWKPIAPAEVREALDYYANYVASFNRDRAAHPQLSYLLISADEPVDLTNFDRWYEREQGEQIGSYLLFRVRLKD